MRYIKVDLAKEAHSVDRKGIVDLIKFYSDWFYAPVDEELENRLYFLDLGAYNNIEDYMTDELVKNAKTDKDKKYGIRYKI
jgi:hypothetical protein